MTFAASKPAFLADADVDALACSFHKSQFAADIYADWPLDRRLDGFLRHRGLTRLVADGDSYNLILDRVMSYIGVKGSR